MTELICITCPKGCHLTVDEANDYAVTGNECARGEAYGKNELQNPMRVVTSTVRLRGADVPRLPVKTSAPIPRRLVFDTMRLLDTLIARAPIKAGDILHEDLFGTGVDLVATKTIATSKKTR